MFDGILDKLDKKIEGIDRWGQFHYTREDMKNMGEDVFNALIALLILLDIINDEQAMEIRDAIRLQGDTSDSNEGQRSGERYSA